ncbi:hypothetical protein NIE79_002983 [Micromonospora sp. NIE79]|uniref:Uncharacterized protein n=1 Tax=Micromonospora trifolii TaxID=2911208 RepID=A0ABS9N4E8_9ACTN|nr:hypothetical protein [Micromonospora trifolii]MCG5444822.1 hypothetical protein [Micromonospora trifolii]
MMQVAIDLGPRVDTAGLPMERRVRHALEVARAYSSWNRVDDAEAVLLDAEQMAPEQVATTSSAANRPDLDTPTARQAFSRTGRTGPVAQGSLG